MVLYSRAHMFIWLNSHLQHPYKACYKKFLIYESLWSCVKRSLSVGRCVWEEMQTDSMCVGGSEWVDKAEQWRVAKEIFFYFFYLDKYMVL